MPKKTWMPKYNPSEEEHEAHMYCMNNGIMISPGGTQTDRYTIDINLGKGWNKSPKTFKSDEVWEVFYNYCLYYFNKRKS